MACVAIVTMGCHRSTTVESTPPATTPGSELSHAEVFEVRPKDWPIIVRSQGSLVADEVTTVGAKLSGRVDQVHVDLGDHVDQGAPLVSLDRRDLELQVRQVQAQLDQARAALGLQGEESAESLEPHRAPPVLEAKAVWDEAKGTATRLQYLRRQQSVSDAQLDQADSAERVAEARYASALNAVHERIALIRVNSAELALAQQRLQDAALLSPYEGYVQSRLVAPGAYVQTGQPMVTVVRTGTLRFRGRLPERYTHGLAIGQPLSIRVESQEARRQIHITRLSPALDEATRSLIFEADIENQDGALRPGLFAEAELALPTNHTAIVVPSSAVMEFAGAEKVWKMVDGRVVEQPVQVGRRTDREIEIREGLQAGDRILTKADVGRLANMDPHPPHAVRSN